MVLEKIKSRAYVSKFIPTVEQFVNGFIKKTGGEDLE